MIKLICITTILVTGFLLTGHIELHAQNQSDDEKVTVVPNRPSISELKIRGRIQGQYANSAGSNSNAGMGADNYSSFEMRRVRLGVQGKIYGSFNFMVEANVLSNVDLDAATLTYTALPQANITFGKVKPQFGHEQNTSSASILTFERTRLDGHLNGGKPLGLRLHGSFDIFSYYLGVYNGQSVGTGRMGSEMDTYLYNVSAGLDLGKIISNELRLDLRADYLHNEDELGYYNFEDAFAISARVGSGPLDLRTEYMKGVQFDDGSISGFYLMPSYFIIPESLQVVLRYENVTGDNGLNPGHNRYADRVPGLFANGNEYSAVYAGVNYLVHGDNLKFMLGFETAENKNNTGNETGRAATLFGGFRMQF